MIFASFVNSREFTELCSRYGITRGTYTPPADISARFFITRLYREVLDREPSSAELATWVNTLLSDRATAGTIAHGFIFGSEFRTQFNMMTNTEFVWMLHRALYGRDPRPIDMDSWVIQLNTGTPRYNVFLSFIYSTEFANICRNLGIRGLTSDFYPYNGVQRFNHFGTRVGCTAVVNNGLRHIGHHPRPNIFTRYAGMNADWCAMFTNYVFEHTGNCALHTHTQHRNAQIRSWTCTTIMNTGRAQGRWADGNFRNPAPGDWILFNWGQPWNTSQHIGIVTGHDGVRVYYVDGNTGGSGANRVLHQSRLLTDGSIRGYVTMF